MNALTIYLNTSKYVMQANFSDHESWADLYRYLPYLRQALSCCVCKNLLKVPMGPNHKVCQHFVCKNCINKPMTLKPQCSWCKKRTGFEESKQLLMVLSCFRKLCQYILSSPIGNSLQSHAKNGEIDSLVSILKEGADYEVDTLSQSVVPPPMCVSQEEEKQEDIVDSTVDVEEMETEDDQNIPLKSLISQQPVVKLEKMKKVKKPTRKNIRLKKYKWYTKPKKKVPLRNSIKNGKIAPKEYEIDTDLGNLIPSSKIKYEIRRDTGDEDRSKLKVKLRAKKVENFSDTDFSSDSETLKNYASEETMKKDKYTSIEPSIKKLKLIFGENEIKICKCGRGGTSSQLTCLGQRCPCYVKKMPCFRCKCRGCRNPRKTLDMENDAGMRTFSASPEHLFVSL